MTFRLLVWMLYHRVNNLGAFDKRPYFSEYGCDKSFIKYDKPRLSSYYLVQRFLDVMTSTHSHANETLQVSPSSDFSVLTCF